MEVERLENDAKATAAKHVANMLQRTDQLEKVEQYKRRVSRKKASVEAMLKTAMQTQLDGVRTGLNDLQTALLDIQDIKHNLQEIEEIFQSVPQMADKLKHVREESMKHSQYAAAMENLKHIFNVPESVQKTQEWINDGKLLLAHQCLSDLENSRDDLLFEMHKLPNQSPTDRNMLKQYFLDVEKQSDELGKQLWLVMRRTLNSVRKEPQVIVTALRIIEREECMDRAILQRKRTTGFLPPGRPKNWRNRAFEVLEEAVQERIEGTQLEVRGETKMWLVRHLELIRQLILDDLQVVKTACIPCFPPEYDIVNKFVKMYHDSLSRHLTDVIASELESNEYITILNWLNVYEGPELMGNPKLMVDVEKLGSLLDNTVVEDMTNNYLKKLESNFQDWMKNTLSTDEKDWHSGHPPEADSQGFFHTSVPVIVFQMLDQHLQVASTVGQELVNRVMEISMQHVIQFTQVYRDAVGEYKNKHFEDRSHLSNFTLYMIAVANNCLLFVELAQDLRERYWKPKEQESEAGKIFQTLTTFLGSLRENVIHFLVDEMFLDLDKELSELVTRKWILTGTSNIETICATLDDYFNDYTRLRPRNFDYLTTSVQDRVTRGYIIAILTRKITLKNYDERKQAADKIMKEAEMLKAHFNKLGKSASKRDSTLDALTSLAEVLRLKDSGLLSLEISGLLRHYPDVTADQLSALIMLRGDINRTDTRQLVAELIPEAADNRTNVKTIFSQSYVS